jgi:hypothetical protein
MQRTIPILHVDSYEEAKSYYVDWLGFAIDWDFGLNLNSLSICKYLVGAFYYTYRSTKVTTRVV